MSESSGLVVYLSKAFMDWTEENNSSQQSTEMTGRRELQEQSNATYIPLEERCDTFDAEQANRDVSCFVELAPVVREAPFVSESVTSEAPYFVEMMPAVAEASCMVAVAVEKFGDEMPGVPEASCLGEMSGVTATLCCDKLPENSHQPSYIEASPIDCSDFDSDDSVKDPDFQLPSKSDENVPGTVSAKSKRRKIQQRTDLEQKGKKRTRQENRWKKNAAKVSKSLGKSYTSFSKKQHTVPAKEIKQVCGEKCSIQCPKKISEDERLKIFNNYWSLGSTERQRHFISTCMEDIKRKYTYKKENSNRMSNHSYYLPTTENPRVRVCKTFFKNTLAITDRPIRTVMSKKSSGCFEEARGKHKNHKKLPEEVKMSIRQHIESIPQVESHYCRSDTKRKYIEGGKSVADLHRDYQELCKEKNIQAGNYVMYSRIFNTEYNLSFFKPKKDQCEVCEAYKNSTEEEKVKEKERYENHLLETHLSRIEKENDKKSEKVVAVYDLQAVLPCPVGETSPFYYTSKLGVYNLTISDLKCDDVNCFVWHEGEAKRGATEIGSSVLKYLEMIDKRLKEPTDVVLYSDNCAGQQKNQYLVAVYLYAVKVLKNIKSVEHKYLITGHTQNEGDNVHSVIERHIKKARNAGPIYVPEQYYTLIRTAKKSGPPYKVHELSHKDFYDVKKLVTDLGVKVNLITEIKILKVQKEHPGKLFFKTSYSHSEYEIDMVTGRRKAVKKTLVLKPAYEKNQGITEKKKKGILELIEKKKCIPHHYLPFYKSL